MLSLYTFIRHHSSVSSRSRTLVKDLWNFTDQGHAAIYGWIKSIRNHKNVTFLDINDGSSPVNIQVVLPVKDFPCNTEFSYGSAIGVEGKVISRLDKIPEVEFLGRKLLFHAPCETAAYPFASEWNYPNKFVRQFPHLRPRQKKVASMLRVRNKVEMLVHEYFQKKNYIHIHTPAITSSDCEGAGELFTVKTNSKATNSVDKTSNFFGSAAYLTVSGQLHLEACSMGLSDVYTLSPAFRAENSRPQTHLCEFHMLEVEMAFTHCLNEVKAVLEDSLKFILSEILKSCEKDLSIFYQEEENRANFEYIRKLMSKPFIDMEYKDVINLINSKLEIIKTGPVQWGDDLNSEHEHFLTSYHNSPVFVSNFPSSIKPFYALSNEDDTCASFDLLFPNCGEMAGGTLREHRHKVLQDKLIKLDLIEPYKWYSELRQFGGAPHGGYGLGFDRLIKFILGLSNIRDVVPFPRAPKLCML